MPHHCEHPQHRPWTPEEYRILRDMAADSKTTTIIAEVLNRTRNSVIGCANRLGVRLLGKGKHDKGNHPWKKQPKCISERNQVRRILKTKEFVKPVKKEPSKGISVFDIREGQCHWINGEGRNGLMCGQPTNGGSWCKEHKAIVFMPCKPRQRVGWSFG